MNGKLIVSIAVLLMVLASGCLAQKSGEKPELSSSTSAIRYQLSDSSQEKGPNSPGEKTLPFDRKIISTANLELEVNNVQSAFNGITNITVTSEGFISGSSMYDQGNRKIGQVTVRVPQKNFYSVVEQIGNLGTLKSKQIEGQDVTEEFIDNSARLDNLNRQEERLREILKMAQTVKDVLEVERELERVRGEIERLTGRLNFLNQSIEMATISVTVKEPAPIAGESWGITDALRQAVSGFIESVNGLIIFTGYILPILVFIIFAVLAALGVKRKILPILRK